METADCGGELAYRATLTGLGVQIREARVDHDAFRRPMRQCELLRCRATCCHDGVVLGGEETAGIRRLVAEHRETFDAYGWSGSNREPVVERGGSLRTATRPADRGERAEDFPAHFARTRCVFLDPEHRCVLQRLAMDGGKHPWFWKPVSCWMHPVLVKSVKPRGRPVITVLAPDEDEAGFASCTPCGRVEPDGEPAAVVLRDELEMLGKLGSRNLLREIG
jgi:hypothetical protein